MHPFNSDRLAGIIITPLQSVGFPMVLAGQTETLATLRLATDTRPHRHTPPTAPSATRLYSHIHPWIFSPPLPPCVFSLPFSDFRIFGCLRSMLRESHEFKAIAYSETPKQTARINCSRISENPKITPSPRVSHWSLEVKSWRVPILAPVVMVPAVRTDPVRRA